MSTVLYLDVRTRCGSLEVSMPSLLTSLTSVECSLNKKSNTLLASTPNKQVRGYFNKMNVPVEAHMDLDAFKKIVMEQYVPEAPVIQERKKPGRKAKTVRIPMGKEQKEKAAEEKKAAKKKQQQKAKEARRAEKQKEKKARQVEKELEKARKEIEKLKAAKT